MRDLSNMPLSMLEAVQYAVKAKQWRKARDPIRQVRSSAENWASRRASLKERQALHQESQFDLHRSEDLLRSRSAGAHATFLPSRPA